MTMPIAKDPEFNQMDISASRLPHIPSAVFLLSIVLLGLECLTNLVWTHCDQNLSIDCYIKQLGVVQQLRQPKRDLIHSYVYNSVLLFSPLSVVQVLFSFLIVVLLFSEQQNNRVIELTFGNSNLEF